ncbi:MAG: ATP-binding cassette domain-containing protein, partial [Rickettsiales bacterium]|nr:ATP-binding cassette domain-containing protein [Rickettsiales bacterium]
MTNDVLIDIKNLHATVDGKEVINGIDLTIKEGEVHAIMGPNGSGKSTLSHVIAGREGYEVTQGDILFKGESILEMEVDERAQAGIFLAFQYPVEIPGVNGMNFLKTSVNAVRKAKGEEELDAVNFLRAVREKLSMLKM